MSARVPADIASSIEIQAAPEKVWEVVSDFARMPEFSPELRKAFVLGSGLGARIIGVNRRGLVVWPTRSKVVRWEPGHAVAWKTAESAATWVYELESTGDTGSGTTLRARRVLPAYSLGTSLLGPVIGGAAGHDTELAAGLHTTLERIKKVVER